MDLVDIVYDTSTVEKLMLLTAILLLFRRRRLFQGIVVTFLFII